MLQELIRAFTLIFIAEMGDKTQILAMAFATRYPVKKVLLGIFLGAFLNHGLAVLLGSYVSAFIPIHTIQIIAGFAFVGFALWTLKPDGDEDDDMEEKARFGPVITVATAFFIGELGDKTQLTAITLATDAIYPLFILCGTVLGMIVTGGLGIIVGKKLGNQIPELAIKFIAASVFMFFGVAKLLQTLPAHYINTQNAILFFGVISIPAYVMIRSTMLRKKRGQESLLVRKSRELHDYYTHMEESIQKICLGTGICGSCQGKECLVGFTKALIQKGLSGEAGTEPKAFASSQNTYNKSYDRESVMKIFLRTLRMLKEDPANPSYDNIHEIRKMLEMILFTSNIPRMESWEEYQKQLESIDKIGIVDFNDL
jgi:putative Ca2+/H+ antiporter (TMEM165/GDT1 family)